MSVRPAGWDNTVSRKKMNARPVRAKMVAPAWIGITATPVSASLGSEVMIPVFFFFVFLPLTTYQSLEEEHWV